MKLKQATQFAIIGVFLQLVPSVMYLLVNLGILTWVNSETNEQNWYLKYSGIIAISGTALLLPFFITLFKSQK
jgi:hypothetical protein